jgi:hypothetical protein
MNLELQRFSSQTDDTLGLFFNADSVYKFRCFTLEDEHRTEKVYGETRIPAGKYELKLRTHGGFHDSYLKRYGADFHKGMVQIMDVKDFTDVLIHAGNTDEDTAGCILVGDACDSNAEGKTDRGSISKSRNAYERLYPEIRDALIAGEKVYLKIRNLDTI